MAYLMHRRKRAGFTLIELLAAMAVLAVIILLLAQMFADSRRVWAIGSRSVEGNMAARAVIDYMVRDISAALINTSNFSMAHYQNVETGDFSSSSDDPRPDELFFVELSDSPNSNQRAVQQVVYYVNNMRDEQDKKMPFRYRLMRGVRKTNDLACLRTPDWCVYPRPDNQTDLDIYVNQVVAENVWSFDLWYYSVLTFIKGGGAGNPPAESEYEADCIATHLKSGQINSMVTGPPVFIDILLEMLSDDESIEIATIAANNESLAAELARKKARRYFTRIYFRNETGYRHD